jgi:hypothetical protein
MLNRQKRNPTMSEKTRNSAHKRHQACQNNVRKFEVKGAAKLDEERLLINLGHLVDSMSSGGKVGACTEIAKQMSQLAGLNGNSWTWRYVASVNSRTVDPGKKFLRVLELLLKEISPREKQWFYFTRRRSVAAVYEKSICAEMITEQMKSLGFKAVTFSRYMQVKSVATGRR